MFPRLKVVGVGGAGGNAAMAMLNRGLPTESLLALNTDEQALNRLGDLPAMDLGRKCTRGMGAGGRPTIGRDAALESSGAIAEQVRGVDMVFVTAGMGGGTGTGAAPVVAHAAREAGALVVGVVSTPFMFEGLRRRRSANAGIAALEEHVDALLVIENDRLLKDGDLSVSEAFGRADEVLADAVLGIREIATRHGTVNLDFAHVREILRDGGRAVMGRGFATTRDGGAKAAVQNAISCPLLDDDSIAGARRILLHLLAGPELALKAVEQASLLLESAANEDAEIVLGVAYDPAFEGQVQATVIATEFVMASAESRPSNLATDIPSARPSKFQPHRPASLGAGTLGARKNALIMLDQQSR